MKAGLQKETKDIIYDALTENLSKHLSDAEIQKVKKDLTGKKVADSFLFLCKNGPELQTISQPLNCLKNLKINSDIKRVMLTMLSLKKISYTSEEVLTPMYSLSRFINKNIKKQKRVIETIVRIAINGEIICYVITEDMLQHLLLTFLLAYSVMSEFCDLSK